MHVRLGEAGRRQHLVEELARAPDEGAALEVLLAARRLADEHEAGLGRAPVEAQVLGRRLQRATVEVGQRGRERFEARGRACSLARRYLRIAGGRRGKLPDSRARRGARIG